MLNIKNKKNKIAFYITKPGYNWIKAVEGTKKGIFDDKSHIPGNNTWTPGHKKQEREITCLKV